MLTIARFFDSYFGRNSDPGHPTMQRDDPTCNIPISLDSPATVSTIKNLVKTPIDFLYLSIILKGHIEPELIQSAIQINSSYAQNNSININHLPLEYKFLDYSQEDQNFLFCIILSCSISKHYSSLASRNFSKLSNSGYKRVSLFRIMKTGTSTLEHSLRKSILGDPPYQSTFLPAADRTNIQLHGQISQNGFVECSWNPIAYATRSYNFAHSHYPIFDMNKPTKSTYSLVSLRDPIDRICSIYRFFSNKFNSVEDFIFNCHPDFIVGQLYFFNQECNLSKAIIQLESISRVLILEQSSTWSDKLSSDLSLKIDVQRPHPPVDYSDKEELRANISNLIIQHPQLSKLIQDEYILFEHAKRLSLN